MFEEEWHIQVSDTILEVKDPKGNVQKIQLEDIVGISIQTNDMGPLGPDVIWLISDGESIISFPMGAAGEKDALYIFQKMNGFDNEELINAMSSVENDTFILLNKIKA